MKKPKIGIIFGAEIGKSEPEYLEAVKKANGEPVVLRPGEKVDFMSLQGLLLTGGGDVEPELYGQKKQAYCDKPERQRDEFEMSTLKQFLTQGKPVFGICKGVQVLNVALGGSLYQDMATELKSHILKEHQYPGALTREEKRALRHEVRLRKNSKLYKIFGEKRQTNSRHHQAIKTLAPSLEAVGESSDGVIEAVESKEHPWVVGVQWHPESQEISDDFAPLFRNFVEQCAALSTR